MARRLSLVDIEHVNIRIRDLCISVDTSPSILEPTSYVGIARARLLQNAKTQSNSKQLLMSINAEVQSGTLTAILGASGSGKTTLLNTVSRRVRSRRLHQSGSITFNGNGGVENVRHAYVMQQDILQPTLTVRETLQYAADLRLPLAVSKEDRQALVEATILELGLKECADTRIGDGHHRGCSGGEKRRTSIGVQLLSNPSVLFLDEPTTGLDATSAFQVVKTLKGLAAKGRTVITTLHQPRSEIWELFDNLLILSGGEMVYAGPGGDDCIAWFNRQGCILPRFVNPAEFVIDQAAVDTRSLALEEESTSRVRKLRKAWVDTEKYRVFDHACEKTITVVTMAMPKATRRWLNSLERFIRQTQTLTRRTIKVTYRDPLGMFACIFGAGLLGVVLGYNCFQLPRTDAGIRSRLGSFWIASGLMGYLFLIFEVYRLSLDITLHDRESSEGCSDVVPFLLARRLGRLFMEDIPTPVIFSAVFFFMAGYDASDGRFGIFCVIMIINHFIAVLLAQVCVALLRPFAYSSWMANMIYTLQTLCSGFFLQIATLPTYVNWTKYIAYSYYIYGALCGNEFENQFYDCPGPGGESSPECAPYTGQYIMKSLGYSEGWVARPMLAAMSFIFLFAIVSALVLVMVKVDMTLAKAVSRPDMATGKENLRGRNLDSDHILDLRLESFGLLVHLRSLILRKESSRPILRGINATFKGGTINVILGPSGSGKTSLLNSISLRLQNTTSTRYERTGVISINGSIVSQKVLRSVCSYVCQDDDALLPSLTVRETLKCAARLRLPSWMSKEEKMQRAENIMLKMGLRDCADSIVGNSIIKGISGGEKRRVSIATQILTEPRILLLDEPTSGLDAFTASSIMEVLKGLAAEGRTIIMTVHQARSSLFPSFGNILLLARGGSPAYSGRAENMTRFFSEHGHECPAHTNPGDFALDLVTVDLQHPDREAETREKVNRLLAAWEDHTELSMMESQDRSKAGSRLTLTSAHVAGEDKGSNTTDKDQATRVSISTQLDEQNKESAPFFEAVSILFWRGIINTRRQHELILARLAQIPGLCIILLLYAAPLGTNYEDIQTRVGLIQMMVSLYFVGVLQNIAVYPVERDVFYREQDDGIYGVTTFLVTYTILELPVMVVASLFFGILIVFGGGLPYTAAAVFVLAFSAFVIVSCGESVGIMINTIFSRNTGFAVNLITVAACISQGLTGVMRIEMPQPLDAFSWINPGRHVVRACLSFAFRGIVFACKDEQKLPSGECPLATGEQVLQLYRLDVDTGVALRGLVAVFVGYRLVAWLVLMGAKSTLMGRKTWGKG